MSNETQENPGDQDQPQFALQKIYLKDLSFESPDPLEAFGKRLENPEINLQLNNEIRNLEDDRYEVVLDITVTAKDKTTEKVIYLVEIKQAGLFGLRNFPEQELAAMLNGYCPGILFPYARETLSSIVERGGYPQLLLAPINFEALYQQHLEKVSQAAAEQADQPKH